MKTSLFITFSLVTSMLFCQEKFFTTLSSDEDDKQEARREIKAEREQAESDFGKLNEKVSFGLSLGFNQSLENLSAAQISPINNTLLITDEQSTSFVLSSVLSVPITYKPRTYYRYVDDDGDENGPVNKISDWSLIAVVNLVTLQGAQSGTVFNQQISGGLGLAYNFDENVSIGLTYELNSFRKPKEFLENLEGQQVMEKGNAISTLDISDNNYFFNKYASTLSLKVIYKLTTK
ncbi:MAG: hypothetical protein AAF466_05815 [Bacteroidota bacterium]